MKITLLHSVSIIANFVIPKHDKQKQTNKQTSDTSPIDGHIELILALQNIQEIADIPTSWHGIAFIIIIIIIIIITTTTTTTIITTITTITITIIIMILDMINNRHNLRDTVCFLADVDAVLQLKEESSASWSSAGRLPRR